MADIRYVFGTVRDGAVVEEFALQGVSMSRKLSGWGTLRGSFGLDQSGKNNIDLVGATIPGLCYVCCERDDIPVWFGIIWSRTYQSQAKSVQITARSLEAYPEKRRIQEALDYNTVDQGTIFLDLWTQLGAGWQGIPVDVPSSFVTGIDKTLTARFNDFKLYGDAMSQLADATNGFDWSISTTKDSDGQYKHDLLVGYPQLGSTDPTQVSFEYPGNIFNYYETASLTEAGNSVFMIGENGAEEVVWAQDLSNFDQVATGLWPRYDHLISRLDVTRQEDLQWLVEQEGKLRKPPMNVVKAFMRAEADPQFGQYSLGDACRLIFLDPLHPEGVNVDTRIVSWNYTPTSNDTVDAVELIFEGDELNE